MTGPASTETSALLPGQAGQRGRSWRGWAAGTLRPHDLTAPLLLLTFVNSLLDVAAYARLRTYSSCMTGNAVLLSLLLTGNGPAGAGNLAATCTSLAAFIAAGAVFGQVGHWVGDRARRWLLASLVVQTALVALAAALVDTPHGTRSALISLLSAAGGAQVALAKGTGNPQISTAILTSPFIDTVGNRDLLRPFSLPSARRRLLIVQWVYLATFFAGAFLGGVGLRHAGTRAVFWASVGLRAAVTLWVGLLPVEDEETKPASD